MALALLERTCKKLAYSICKDVIKCNFGIASTVILTWIVITVFWTGVMVIGDLDTLISFLGYLVIRLRCTRRYITDSQYLSHLDGLAWQKLTCWYLEYWQYALLAQKSVTEKFADGFSCVFI